MRILFGCHLRRTGATSLSESNQKKPVLLKADERLDLLKKENIQIIQSPSVFSFSLDAVLLANFASVPKTRQAKIVDFCSGNGAVAFLLTGKTKNPIIGVEIQDRLIDMARRTVQLNELEERVSFIHADINDITDHIPADSVDVISCNPPYFKDIPSSTKNTHSAYTIARHEVMLNLDQLMKKTSHLLKMNGKAYFVHRPDRLLEILDTMRANRLAPKRLQFIYPKTNKEANMILIEAIKDGKTDGLKILPPFYVHDETGDYSTEVKAILFGE